MRTFVIVALWGIGLTSLANGAWMLAHAWTWFTVLPGVADTGAVNGHFIHDVGVVYLLCGAGLIWCVRNLASARPLFVGIALFYVGHALDHVVEIMVGQLPHSHWWIDLPLVFAPAALLGVLALPRPWRQLTQTS
jgi:hypothetical protein